MLGLGSDLVIEFQAVDQVRNALKVVEDKRKLQDLLEKLASTEGPLKWTLGLTYLHHLRDRSEVLFQIGDVVASGQLQCIQSEVPLRVVRLQLPMLYIDLAPHSYVVFADNSGVFKWIQVADLPETGYLVCCLQPSVVVGIQHMEVQFRQETLETTNVKEILDKLNKEINPDRITIVARNPQQVVQFGVSLLVAGANYKLTKIERINLRDWVEKDQFLRYISIDGAPLDQPHFRATYSRNNDQSALQSHLKRLPERIVAPDPIKTHLHLVLTKGSRFYHLVKYRCVGERETRAMFGLKTDLGFFAHASGILVGV